MQPPKCHDMCTMHRSVPEVLAWVQEAASKAESMGHLLQTRPVLHAGDALLTMPF